MVVKESRSVSEGLARLDPPTDGLVPGMTVDVEIVVAEAPHALQVPAEAIFYQADGDPFVYRIDGNRVRVTPVRLGLSSVAATRDHAGAGGRRTGGGRVRRRIGRTACASTCGGARRRS